MLCPSLAHHSISQLHHRRGIRHPCRSPLDGRLKWRDGGIALNDSRRGRMHTMLETHKDKTLLVGRNTFLVLNLRLDIVDGV